MTAPRLRQGLLDAGILVRDGAGVGFPGHLRIAIGTPAQNNRLLDAGIRPPSSSAPHAHPEPDELLTGAGILRPDDGVGGLQGRRSRSCRSSCVTRC